MKAITSIFQWVVFSNIWISLGVSATTYVGMHLEIVPYDFIYCLIAGLSTLFAYNIQRIFKLPEGIPYPSERHLWIEKNKTIILCLSIIGLVLGLVLSPFSLTLNAVLFSIPFILLVILYAYSIGRLKALRQLPFTKIVIISSVWAWTIAVLPIINVQDQLQANQWGYILFVFLFVFALCIPFDIRDLENDRNQIRTLPSTLGVSESIFIAILLHFVCLYLALHFNWLVIETTVILSSIFVLFGLKKRKELYYTGILDGMFLLLFVIYKLYAVIL